MNSSNAFSRMLFQPGAQSIYETIEQQEQAAEEDPLGLADHDALNERFTDEDLDRLLAEDTASRLAAGSPPSLGPTRHSAGKDRPRWAQGTIRLDNQDDLTEHDDPEQLLLDDNDAQNTLPRREHGELDRVLPQPIPGPSQRSQRVKWDRQERVDSSTSRLRSPRRDAQPHVSQLLSAASEADKAMMRWSNVTDLDAFLRQAYDYYLGKGYWSIILADILSLCTLAFVATLTVFLSSCVKYSAIRGSKHLDEVVIPRCTEEMSFFPSFILWVVAIGFLVRAARIMTDAFQLGQMRQFYVHVLGVPDSDMQTISWQEIVSRIMNLREQNPRTARDLTDQAMRYLKIKEPSKVRMDAHDIANRIMRRENFLIALFNKDILDLSIPLPGLRHRSLFTQSLQEVVLHSIQDYVFNEKGQVRQAFLKDADRQALADGLKRRFIVNGFLYVLIAPVYVSYHLFVYFLRYFKEFEVDPSQLSSRRYTPYALWKFKEFNELDHFFDERIRKSYPAASRYIDQFPKDKTNQVARFVAFVFGSLTAILATVSLLDPDVFLGFELTPDRTVLFYLTLFGGIWRVAHGMVPDETLVYEPEETMQEVVDFTHYSPTHWHQRLHSDEIRQEFSQLYKMKVLIFLEEMMGMIVTPYILWFSLPNSAERIIDFFREFTVHIDGLGYVCWFAHFNFKNPGMTGGRVEANAPAHAQPADIRAQYYEAKDGKMMTSYYNFLDSYSGIPKRRGDRYPPSRRAQASTSGRKGSFRPPPTFPALNANGKARSSAIDSQQHADPPIAWSAYKSPPTKAAGSQLEPSASLLLDPQHQPSVRLQPSKQRNHSRYRPQRGPAPVSTIDESRNVGASQANTRKPRDEETESAIIEQDSNLGDSWKGAEDDNQDEDASEDTADGEGVLGLLYQFQKGQEIKRGPTLGF